MLGILQQLLQHISADQRPLLYGSTLGGAATVNPYMAMRSPEFRGLLGVLMSQNLNAPKSDSLMPQRNVMEIQASPFGNLGIHAYPFPGARLPNAYRGQLTQPGVPGVPDAPEHYVPGFANQWLRGT